jgi:hypothetical protein
MAVLPGCHESFPLLALSPPTMILLPQTSTHTHTHTHTHTLSLSLIYICTLLTKFLFPCSWQVKPRRLHCRHCRPPSRLGQRRIVPRRPGIWAQCRQNSLAWDAYRPTTKSTHQHQRDTAGRRHRCHRLPHKLDRALRRFECRLHRRPLTVQSTSGSRWRSLLHHFGPIPASSGYETVSTTR